MLVLIIDTATPAITTGICAITDGVADGPADVRSQTRRLPARVKELSERVVVDARRHAEALVPLIGEVLESAGATPADLAAVVAGVGPGPYTGLRVGLVTAQAFAAALGIPAYPVCTLDALAAAALGNAGPPGLLVAATDARRHEVYWAAYEGAEAPRRVHGPAVGRPEAVRAWVEAAVPPGTVAAAGAGAALYTERLGLPALGPEYPTVAALAGLAAVRILDRAPGEPLVPLYLRRPDAQLPGARKPVHR